MERLFSRTSALIVSALALTITFLYPLSGDNALYMYMADLLLKGHVPYIGSWDHNFPGIVFLHAVHVAVAGGSVFGFHLFDSALHLVGMAFLYRLVLLLCGRTPAAWLAVVCATVYYVAGGLELVGERDIYLSLLLVIGITLLLEDPVAKLKPAAVVLGSMLVIRPTAGIFLAVIALWLLIGLRENRWKSLMCFTGYGSLPILIVLGLYWVGGGIEQFIEATITYNLGIYAQPTIGGLKIGPLQKLEVFHFMTIAGLGALISRDWRAGVLMVAIMIATWLYLIPVYRFNYHYHPTALMVFATGAAGLLAVERMFKASSSTRAYLLTLGVTAALCWVMVSQSHVLRLLRDVTTRDVAPYQFFYGSREWGIAVQDSIADFLKANDAKKVQSFTSTMYPLLQADVVPSSRFTNIFNLTWRSPKTNELMPMQLRWREEYVAALKLEPPDFIISSRKLPDHVFNNGYLPQDPVGSFPELDTILRDRFTKAKEIGGYTIYQKGQ